ncbi:hypothetical protein E5676_scaffold195G00610 [Cucumis melo var. makuwa]|uniref:NBS-LRR type resistance protein n=1 Tax=Cucumis melo var. makuwa TaxID=1194695 RepID=A0A5D3DH06_CUCMM|nr:hypothetical protein E5676_scaffold195G00610 [Cucumis melo var. makuwa]
MSLVIPKDARISLVTPKDTSISLVILKDAHISLVFPKDTPINLVIPNDARISLVFPKDTHISKDIQASVSIRKQLISHDDIQATTSGHATFNQTRALKPGQPRVTDLRAFDDSDDSRLKGVRRPALFQRGGGRRGVGRHGQTKDARRRPIA